MASDIISSGIEATAETAGDLIAAESAKNVAEQEAKAKKEIEAAKRAQEQAELEETTRQFDLTAEMEKAASQMDTEKFNRLQGMQADLENLETQKFQAMQEGDIGKFNALQKQERELQQAALAERTIGTKEDIRRYNLGTGEDIRRYEIGLGESDILRKSYQKALERAGLTGTEAGEEFMRESRQSAPELQRLAKDIRERGTETMADVSKKMAADLATGGVRGGQAATQMRRGVGEVGRDTQRDINQVLAQDAMNRQAERMAYQKALGLGAEQFMMSPESARMYETGDTFAGLAKARPAEEITAPSYDYPTISGYTPYESPDSTLSEIGYNPIVEEKQSTSWHPQPGGERMLPPMLPPSTPTPTPIEPISEPEPEPISQADLTPTEPIRIPTTPSGVTPGNIFDTTPSGVSGGNIFNTPTETYPDYSESEVLPPYTEIGSEINYPGYTGINYPGSRIPRKRTVMPALPRR